MTFREQTELLMAAIQNLMALYQDITEMDSPFVRMPFPDSALKKILIRRATL